MTATPDDEQEVWVTLYCEQVAEVRVRAAAGTPVKVLQQLALEGLDASGGAEWRTRAGWVEHVAWTDGQRLSDDDVRATTGPGSASLERALTVEHGETTAPVGPTVDHGTDRSAKPTEGR